MLSSVTNFLASPKVKATVMSSVSILSALVGQYATGSETDAGLIGLGVTALLAFLMPGQAALNAAIVVLVKDLIRAELQHHMAQQAGQLAHDAANVMSAAASAFAASTPATVVVPVSSAYVPPAALVFPTTSDWVPNIALTSGYVKVPSGATVISIDSGFTLSTLLTDNTVVLSGVSALPHPVSGATIS